MNVIQTLSVSDKRIVNFKNEDSDSGLAESMLDVVSPPPNVELKSPQSDEALTRIAFYGYAAHRLERPKEEEIQKVKKMRLYQMGEAAGDVLAAFKVDLSGMGKFAVREGFDQYGGTVYFDQTWAPIAMKKADGQIISPKDSHWEHTKFVWRCSLVAYITMVDHLLNLHFAVASMFMLALVEKLPTDHPIRRAVHPFTFRTALVNHKAGSALLPKNSIVHHMTSLEWESIETIVAAVYRTGPEWQPLPERCANMATSMGEDLTQKLPLCQDGVDLYNAFLAYFNQVISDNNIDATADKNLEGFWATLRAYTAPGGNEAKQKYIRKTITNEDLAKTLAQFAFMVTGQHESVGSISEYVFTPDHGGARILPMQIRVDAQSFFIGKSLMAMTSLRTPPLMSNFASFWNKDKPTEAAAWAKLQALLQQQDDTVKQRNQDRQFEIRTYQPSILECAVSV